MEEDQGIFKGEWRASNIASRIASDGFVTVSERMSTILACVAMPFVLNVALLVREATSAVNTVVGNTL